MLPQSEALQAQAFDFVLMCEKHIGKTISIYSRLSLRGNGYDRHHTMLSAHRFTLKNAAVRISGAIIMLLGDAQHEHYEIDLASIRSIEHDTAGNGWHAVTEQYTEQIFRQTRLSFSPA